MASGADQQPGVVCCPLCGGRGRRLGIRGNREHFGADPCAVPHLWTHVVRCRSCDFLYTDPVLPEAPLLERAFYSDPERYQAFEPSAAPAVIAARLAWLGQHRRPGRLLDIGAGKGEFVSEARRSGWDASGVEPSAGLRRYAAEQLGVALAADLAAAGDGPAERSFDVVTLNHVLEHVEEPVGLLGRAEAFLREGGLLLVEVPNCDSLFLRVTDGYFRLRGLDWSSRLSPVHPPFHRFGYTRRSLRHALEQAGFAELAARTFSGTDRSYRTPAGASPLAAALRLVTARALSILPNRELLCVLARRRAESR